MIACIHALISKNNIAYIILNSLIYAYLILLSNLVSSQQRGASPVDAVHELAAGEHKVAA